MPHQLLYIQTTGLSFFQQIKISWPGSPKLLARLDLKGLIGPSSQALQFTTMLFMSNCQQNSWTISKIPSNLLSVLCQCSTIFILLAPCFIVFDSFAFPFLLLPVSRFFFNSLYLGHGIEVDLCERYCGSKRI